MTEPTKRSVTDLPRQVPWLSLLAGGSLVVAGFRSGSFLGGLLAAVGGGLLYRSARRSAATSYDRRSEFARGVSVKTSIVVNSSPEECYRFWRALENLPRFMDHLQAVRVISDKRSRWVAKAVGGVSAEWDAEIVKDEPNQVLGWRSLSGSAVATAGSVRFEPLGPSPEAGTQVTVALTYNPPAGALGAAFSKLFGESPAEKIDEELRRFKSIIEHDRADSSPSTPSHA